MSLQTFSRCAHNAQLLNSSGLSYVVSLFPPLLGVQNVVFGQLGALALGMRELGLKQSDIERQILDMSRGAQLTEEHEYMLSRSIIGGGN